MPFKLDTPTLESLTKCVEKVSKWKCYLSSAPLLEFKTWLGTYGGTQGINKFKRRLTRRILPVCLLIVSSFHNTITSWYLFNRDGINT